MNSRKEGVVMLADTTTLAIVLAHPIRPLSGSIIPKKADPYRRYLFFLASVGTLFSAEPIP